MKSLEFPEKIEESILVTHKECTDGAGCAVMYMHAGGKAENIKYVTAGGVEKFIKKSPVVQDGKFLIFADLGLTSSKQADVLEKRGSCVIIDHHKTSQHLSDRPWCNIEMDACGTELFRRYLLSGSKDVQWGSRAWIEWGALIDDRDRWLNQKLPLSEQLVDLMNFLGQETFVWHMRDWPGRLVSAMSHAPFMDREWFVVNVLREKRNEEIENILKKTIIVDQEWGKTGYVVTSNHNISNILSQMLARHPEIKVAAQINFDKNMVSLRSRIGETDVSEIAMDFKGGGHAAASGHPLTNDILQYIIQEIH